MTIFNVFRPTDGAILDHESLQAIADTPSQLLSAYLDSLTPNTPNLVLYGLEMIGEMSAGGPPGSIVNRGSCWCSVYTGAAILSDSAGKSCFTSKKISLPWPTQDPPSSCLGWFHG